MKKLSILIAHLGSEWAVLLIALPIFFFVNILFSFNYVVGPSMLPLIEDNEFLVSSRVHPLVGWISRGDIVISQRGSSSNLVIKRVIAIPGDEVYYHDGVFTINGNIMEEPYIINDISSRPQALSYGPVILSDGEYFIAGDNRNSSFDSRQYGPVHISRIHAKVLIGANR